MDNNGSSVILEIFGTFCACILSWLKWHSVGWLMVNGLFGWLYVIYYAFKYGIKF